MKSNILRRKLAYSLWKEARSKETNLFAAASKSLLASGKNRPSLNLGEISRNTKEGSRILVAGKVLGGGSLSHRVTIIAYSFSQSAKQKIISSGSKFMGLSDFMESGQSSEGIVILG